jgi:hypothetical protein
MPNPTTASGIRDNHGRGVVAEFLKEREEIQSGEGRTFLFMRGSPVGLLLPHPT